MPGQVILREVKVFDGASLSDTPQDFGTPSVIAAYKVSFVNASNRDVLITDGTSQDALYLPAASTLSIGEGFCQEGKALNVQAVFRSRTQLQIAGVTGESATGTIIATILGE